MNLLLTFHTVVSEIWLTIYFLFSSTFPLCLIFNLPFTFMYYNIKSYYVTLINTSIFCFSFEPVLICTFWILCTSYIILIYPYTSCQITLHPYFLMIPWNQLEEEKEKVHLSESRQQDMTSNWLAERDVLKEQLSDLQTRNDNLQTSLVNRDVTIEKLVRMLTCVKKTYQYLLMYPCKLCMLHM